MDTCPWHQVDVAFADWARAENTALTHLAPVLDTAETNQLIASWYFVRKAPCWRIRYLPHRPAGTAQTYIQRHLDDLKRARHIENFTPAIYEPEIHAFGGIESMDTTHRLFHRDSRHLLTYLQDTKHAPASRHRRELSIILCANLLHTAGLDWYEEGDVWARVAAHREPPERVSEDKADLLQVRLRRLLSVDTGGLTGGGFPLAFANGWARAFAAAGTELADLAAHGLLHRGLRAVLAHHIIFTWNRHGIPHATQAVIAYTAKTVVFGPDLTADHQTRKMADCEQ
ncbi:thiopeptide-type bacteriocin biosynthesis protein [Frankia sp. Cj3]|uniref:thiopeptide-type bacteriocin biosynthesis protein n=1 Tax=Frankia sp. Cj3 TaxID=2880976 RepID=UPI001EF6CA68|nr:thiopeptide-type bacteriocin biosynthesis protein [Frankia sp. Cj3]